MQIARTRDELSGCLARLRGGGRKVALVPTMGALHAGHLSLLAAARDAVRGGARAASSMLRRDAGSDDAAAPPPAVENGVVVASIFVNPLQFGDAGDLARYPRDEAGDASKLAASGCDLLWLPAASTMYPAGDATTVEVQGPALGFEGAARPGHFRGVATVVAKLFGQVRPDAACFGEKDFQQLQVIRRMVSDLSLPVSIVGVPTCREADGLAMSSRNRFLSAEERVKAPLLYATLIEARTAIASGAPVAGALDAARHALEAAGFGFEYLSLVSAETLSPLAAPEAGARLIAAVKLGAVRLLDNVAA